MALGFPEIDRGKASLKYPPDFSRAGAVKMAEKWNQEKDPAVCAFLAYDAALPDSKNVPEVLYAAHVFLFKEKSGFFFPDIVEILGGTIIEDIAVEKWLSQTPKEQYAKKTHEWLVQKLKEAGKRDAHLVIRTYWKGATLSHARLVKPGKQDPNEIYAFDVFEYVDAPTQCGWCEIKEEYEYMRWLLPYDAKMVEVITFRVDKNCPYLVPAPVPNEE